MFKNVGWEKVNVYYILIYNTVYFTFMITGICFFQVPPENKDCVIF